MTIRKSLGNWAGLAVVALSVSGCAMPPVVTMASFAADVFSYGASGKSVTDHGISIVMQQDCALLRVFDGEVCSDYPPSEDTPEGALVALAPLRDPTVNPAARDPMILPRSLAYLDGSLGHAVASAPEPRSEVQAAAFAELSDERGEFADMSATPAPGYAFGVGMTYLSAGING